MPGRVDGLVPLKLADGIRPALCRQRAESVTDLDAKECIIAPSLGRVHVEVGWHDVVVSHESDRRAALDKLASVLAQSVKPPQLVVKLRTRPRIAVRQVETADKD